MANRVDELEDEVADLRARVDGLLSELTDTKTRVSELEEQLEEQTPDDTNPKLDSDTGQINDVEDTDTDDKDIGEDSDIIVV